MSNQTSFNKTEKDFHNKNNTSGIIRTGVVMDNRSPNKNGAVKIWIEGSNFEQNDPNGWVIANYSPVWYGCTESITANNTFYENPKSYGFNFPVIDVGTRVAFFTTESGQYYYFTHIPSHNMQGMIPGIHYEKINDKNEPVTEYNKLLSEDSKAIYEPLSIGLKKQGLENDFLRGLSSASPKREVPSRAFGILTTRGSQFVLDDGFTKDENGDNWDITPTPPLSGKNISGEMDSRQSEMIRLRTRSGAQILISETSGHIYMINRDGTVWVELNNSGNFDVWSLNGCNFRTNGSFNLRADQDINIEAGQNINIRTQKGNITEQCANSIQIKSVGELDLASSKIGITSEETDLSGLVTAPAMTTDKFTIGPANPPQEVKVPQPVQQADAKNSKLETIITRLLYKEPCLIHNEVVETIYTTSTNDSQVIPQGSFNNISTKSELEKAESKKTFKETIKDGKIICDSDSGEHAEFDLKTGKRLK